LPLVLDRVPYLDLDQITDTWLLISARKMSVQTVLGDPSIYSALAEQTRRLDRAGVS
jgi:precorrin-4 methylase